MDTMAGESDSVEVGGRRFRFDRAGREDVAAIVAMLADDPLGAGREPTVDAAGYQAAFDAIDVDPAHLLVVVRDGAGDPAGTMQLTLLPGLSRGGATRLQIEAVRIAAPHRGHGLGAAMIEWAHDYGRRNGARLVQLSTDNSRTDAHRFYARLGYRASHVGMKRVLD